MSVGVVRSFLNACRTYTDAAAVIMYNILTNGSGPPAALAVVGGSAYRPPVLPPGGAPPSISDGLLWAVPKQRRSAERRATRRFGAENWPNGRKLIRPKNNLIFCFKCGGHHLPGLLCMTCYTKVMEETREMQRAISAKLGIQPVDREVAVVYRGEAEAIEDQQAPTVQLVEMPKERPQWFSKNLSQKVTSSPAETAAVKPTDLG